MDEVQIRPEHEWLRQLVGEWSFEAVAVGPDGHEHRVTGTEVVRSVGEAWVIGEATTQEPDGRTGRNVITLGFDPDRGKFVGTFITSMMTFLWNYTGELDDESRILVLDTEGPDFTQGGEMAPYQDRIEVVDQDRRVMSSYARGEDGSWQQFMKMTYTRQVR